MSSKKSYSLDEARLMMDEFIENSAEELIVELRQNWEQQEKQQYVQS